MIAGRSRKHSVQVKEVKSTRWTYVVLLAVFFIVNACNVSNEEKGIVLKAGYVPAVVGIDEKPTLYYELIAENRTSDSIRITRLEVIDTADSKFFIAFEGDMLYPRIGLTTNSAAIRGNVIAPHTSAIIFMELVLPSDKSIFSLTNVLHFSKGVSDDENSLSLTILPDSKSRVLVGPPVTGGPWVAIYDPSWERGHRRVIYTTDSVNRIPGRFAIDFILTSGDGHHYTGDENEIKNWLGYGATVIAVADGVVASTNDSFDESPTLSGHKDYSPAEATGNYVSIEIGTDTYAFYEHLKPHSIRVKQGDYVHKGDTIAMLGYTGNTTGPHLHFHIANKNSPLGAESVAYGFERFHHIGSYPTLENFGKLMWTPAVSLNKTRVAERPGPNAVVIF